MSWNEPGKGRDPWGGNGRESPPDLDELVRKMQARLRGLFGGGGPRSVGDGGAGPGGGSLLLVIVGVLALAVFALSAYRIDAPEQGIVLRLGAYHRTAPPGLHFKIPFVEVVEKVNTSRIDNFDYKNQMLTSDENIVYVESNVQFRREEPRPYLFNVRMPDMTLEDVAESAIREVIGKNVAEYVLSEGRSKIAEDARDLMQDTLDAYGTGIRVSQFNLKRVQPPPEVQAAVDDATKAREDKERFRLAAEAYSNDIIPRARGAASRQLAEAEAYRERVIADAQGEAARFEALLAEYERAPKVTRKRLYLETVEAIFGSNAKVLMDTEGGGNLVYLPMDKLLEQQRARQSNSTVDRQRESATSRTSPRDNERRAAENLRSRN